MLWRALALGADLGGNATAVGATANVVILGLAQRSGQPISFLEFTTDGAVVAVVTMLVCVRSCGCAPSRSALTGPGRSTRRAARELTPRR